MNETQQHLDHLKSIDESLVQLAKGIKILSAVSWPPHIQTEFLADWETGQARLPEINYTPNSAVSETRNALDELTQKLDPSDPLEGYLFDTARSYADVCELMDCLGTARASELSCQLYGKPRDLLSGGRVDNFDAASHFLDVSRQFYHQHILVEEDYRIPASALQTEMMTRTREVITGHNIDIVIDDNLVSKAAAGATRVRLRGGARFSQYDVEQLLQHEVFVHSLTALNGREQPLLKSMSLGAPRTTRAQEGLATFAELVTGSIDIARVERIALRVSAIDRALSGANFIDVFRYLLDCDQPETESFNSTMRIFRGVPLDGGSAFTKDNVYLHGLMEVHTFFRWAFSHQRLELTRNFFAGRMTIGDAVRLDPYFQNKQLAQPRYLPPWMTRTNGLAGYLAFSVFSNQIPIHELDAEHDFDGVKGITGEI